MLKGAAKTKQRIDNWTFFFEKCKCEKILFEASDRQTV